MAAATVSTTVELALEVKCAMRLQLDRERAMRVADAKNAVLDAASDIYDVYLNNEHDSLSMHAALTEFGLKMEVLREVQGEL